MMFAHLLRVETGEQGTFGVFAINGFCCRTVELPWKENRQSVSCIPKGGYVAELRQSPRYGEVYLLKDVPGRSGILIHSGNLAGDVFKGWHSHSEGCILLGEYDGFLGKQRAVLNSRETVRLLAEATRGESFILEISEMY